MNRRQFLGKAALGTAYLMTAGGILIPSTVKASQEETLKAVKFEPSYSEVFDLEVRNMLGNPTGEKIPVQVSSGIDNKAMYISLKPLDQEQKVRVNKFTKLDLVTPTSMHLQSARLFQNLRAFGMLGEPQWYELASQPYPIALSEMLLMMGKSELDVPRLSSWESRLRQYKEQRELWGAQDLEFIIEDTMEKCGNNTAYERFLFGEIRELDEKMNLTLGNSVQEVIKVNYLGELGDAPAYALIKASFTPPHKSSQAELVELIPIGTSEIIEKNKEAIKALDIQLSSSAPPEGKSKVKGMKMRMVGVKTEEDIGISNMYLILNYDPQSGRFLVTGSDIKYNLADRSVLDRDLNLIKLIPYHKGGVTTFLLPGGNKVISTYIPTSGQPASIPGISAYDLFEYDLNSGATRKISDTNWAAQQAHPEDIDRKNVERNFEYYFKGHKLPTTKVDEQIAYMIESPDRKKIIFGYQANPQFSLYDSETGRTLDFMANAPLDREEPKWAYDSERFTYSQQLVSGGDKWYSIIVSDLQGNNSLLFREKVEDLEKAMRNQFIPDGNPVIISDTEAVGIGWNANNEHAIIKYQLSYE
ncbi:MAG: hypothetical protein ABIH72_01225 [archaeon]